MPIHYVQSMTAATVDDQNRPVDGEQVDADGNVADDFLIRYVADREKLFSVSRSVSVTEMGATLAHELNQPIGTVANILQCVHTLLQREGVLSSEIEKTLARADDQVRYMSKIIARIRSFTDAHAPQPTSLDLYTVLARTIDLLDWVLRARCVRVGLSAEQKSFPLNGDAILLQQVFVNLLRNAVDAVQLRRRVDDRMIDVRIAILDNVIQVSIADRGCGLSDDVARSLFEPFRTSKPDGMGVGLNICRSFVEMHRGRLWLDNNEHGGCTARVHLPCSMTPATSASPVASKTARLPTRIFPSKRTQAG